jgi:hypothetical protein
MRGRFWFVLGVAVIAVAASEELAVAQINPSPVYGTSTAGGSGGTPTGPTNPGGLGFGTSTGAGSGGVATGPLNPNAYGFGTSSAGGSGGVATGPTVPGLRIMSDPGGRSVLGAAPGTVAAGRAARHRRHVYRTR